MAHMSTIVIVSALACGEIEAEVSRILAPYYANMSVAPYIIRPNNQELQDMTRFYQTDNLEVLAQHLDEWFNCDEAGVDEEGLYGISTNNPQGWWDSWVIENWIDSLEDKSVFSIGEFIELIDEDPEISPMVVVEPDGKWHDQEGVDPTWQKEILSNYPDYLVVLCDLHI